MYIISTPHVYYYIWTFLMYELQVISLTLNQIYRTCSEIMLNYWEWNRLASSMLVIYSQIDARAF